jgi:RNA polymerase sigma-70 factor (ECF subfamily)
MGSVTAYIPAHPLVFTVFSTARRGRDRARSAELRARVRVECAESLMSSDGPAAFGLSLPANLAGYGVDSAVPVQDEVLRLFDECAPRLRRYVSTFGLGAGETDDVVQEVFLLLFRHLAAGRSRSNLKGWIFQVGHNQALKRRGKATRRQRTEAAWDATLAESVPAADADPEEQLASDRRARRLRSVVRALPERDRRCLYLRAEGLRYREIAHILDISLGAVAKSLARAMTRLANADES